LSIGIRFSAGGAKSGHADAGTLTYAFGMRPLPVAEREEVPRINRINNLLWQPALSAPFDRKGFSALVANPASLLILSALG
jgi:hypothetical protein